MLQTVFGGIAYLFFQGYFEYNIAFNALSIDINSISRELQILININNYVKLFVDLNNSKGKTMKEWYTYQEIAELYGADMDRLYNVVSLLRRMRLAKTTPNPANERQKLIHVSSLDAIKQALQSNGQPGNIA